jgi:hypothetical protein
MDLKGKGKNDIQQIGANHYSFIIELKFYKLDFPLDWQKLLTLLPNC